MKVFPPRAATKEELSRVHAPSYIAEVLDEHRCYEWQGPREDLSTLAALFAGGTLVALEKLLNEGFKTAIHFPGAKHHAQYDHSSGFCVFADFALAADIASRDYGLKVAIYDFDGHHGDGTENLTLENDKVLTVSVHQKGIFPGTGNASIPEKLAYNVPLVPKTTPWDDGMGDDGLGGGLSEFIIKGGDFKPDLIMIAAGADGFWDDPLTGLTYTKEGIVDQGTILRRFFPKTKILVGGAGGYLPDTATPDIWASYAVKIATEHGWNEYKEKPAKKLSEVLMKNLGFRDIETK
jgi:acetoin utilization protein AcuC